MQNTFSQIIRVSIIVMALISAYTVSQGTYKDIDDIIEGSGVEFAYGAYTVNDRDCMTRVIYEEARGESHDGWKAVFDVTLNRVFDKRWPNSICDVINQKKQYSGIENPGTGQFEPDTFEAIEDYVGVWLTTGTIDLDANHYTRKDIRRVWMKDMIRVKTIGNHKFFRG